MKKVVVNGKFLTQKLTGVQRYAYELLLEMDKLVSKNQIEILIPNWYKSNTNFKNIIVVNYGNIKNITIWEQIDLPVYLFKNKLIGLNLCNSAPIINPGIVTIHDVSYLVNPKFYSLKFRVWYRIMCALNIHRCKMLFTVSNFSKSEIIKYYKISHDKVNVIYNGWQHMNRIEEDNSLAKKYIKINMKNYYFCLSSLSKNKNFECILNIAKKNQDVNFIIAGNSNLKIFKNDFKNNKLKNVFFVGYITDGQMKYLMKNCKAFIFPSFYEGFGIPPLEALSCGAKIIISNTSSLPEIFQGCAYYIDPNDKDINLNLLLSRSVDNYNNILGQYSWSKSAKRVLDFIDIKEN